MKGSEDLLLTSQNSLNSDALYSVKIYCKIQILIFDMIKEFYKNPEGHINCTKNYKKIFFINS